ncbi:MAG: hypothetical protein GXP40_12330 [Chloroflexi bacterium]|nr:hypothetical protein [Chloroflexota bacterium]
MKRIIVFAILLLTLLSGCSSPAPGETPTPAPDLPSPTEGSAGGDGIPARTATPVPAPSPTLVPLERAQYTLTVTLDYARKFVDVEQTIRYPNHSGEALNDLVLAVEPNLWVNCFSLSELEIDDTPVGAYTLDSQRLTVDLPQPLPAGATLTLALKYSLSLPEIAPTDPNLQRPRIFGYSTRQINLTNWYPFIVPYEAGAGWILHDPWYYGEHLVYEAADYEVNLRFADPDSAPVVAASGFVESSGEWTRYTLEKGRTFALSASPEFQVVSGTVGEVTVFSYYLPLNEKPARAVLQASIRAVQAYERAFGAYPHKTLSAVQGDFNDGMEYSAFYFLPRDFYNLYDGTPQNYLTFVAVHETSHQWWFEQVANDQALEPWLDESLATYSEHIFYEELDPALIPWWWAYRVDFYQPEGWVDIPVYEGGGFRPYTDAVYLRGAHFLEDLRQRIGDEAFFAFLQDYLSRESGRIATPDDFFRILRQHTDADFSDIVGTYFQTPH